MGTDSWYQFFMGTLVTFEDKMYIYIYIYIVKNRREKWYRIFARKLEIFKWLDGFQRFVKATFDFDWPPLNNFILFFFYLSRFRVFPFCMNEKRVDMKIFINRINDRFSFAFNLTFCPFFFTLFYFTLFLSSRFTFSLTFFCLLAFYFSFFDKHPPPPRAWIEIYVLNL